MLVLPLGLFWETTIGGRTLIPGDNLYQWEPWASQADQVGVGIPHNGLLSDLVLENYAWKRFILYSMRQPGGLTDRLRSAAGLETLDFEGGENGKGASVKVGKYIGDKIYLSIQQGKSLESSKVGVKVDITPNVSVESRIDQAGDSDIGIIYRYDY